MAVKLDTMPKATRSGAGRAEKYPYAEWFTGEPIFLAEGKDYEVGEKGVEIFVTTLRQAAKRRDLALQIVRVVDGPNGTGLAVKSKPYVPRASKPSKNGKAKTTA